MHCTAGVLLSRDGVVPGVEQVQAATSEVRAETSIMARGAAYHLGPCPSEIGKSEADLRVFAHDVLNLDHDKDYRCLAAFPPSLYEGHDLHIVRMDPHGSVTTEIIHHAGKSKTPREVWLLVHKGHMRLLNRPPSSGVPQVVRSVEAAGWEIHLEAVEGPEACVRARDLAKCPRCDEAAGDPLRIGERQPATLGLYPLPSPEQKIGGWVQGPLEPTDLDDTFRASDNQLRQWLGTQGPLFDRALKEGTTLIEVYAGVGRLSDAVLSQGRVAIKLGLEHGQDFRLAKDRAMARCLFKRLKPEHAWFAWPCTPFCAWMKLAVLRNCNVAPRLKEGRVHLRFSLQLAHSQRASGRQAHCENPLTSTAWREPAATQEFSQPQWHWTRLDQCTTGLVGPQGDLHLKPTLIRTTDAALRDALSLRCPADHPHELVQGAATAASAMYSPRLAKLAADILCRSTPLVRVGGGGTEQFYCKSAGTRVGKGDEARSAPGHQPWYQPLKELGGLPHQFKGTNLEKDPGDLVRDACKGYLDLLRQKEYSVSAFKEAAEKGTSLLKAARGWEEACRALRRIWLEEQGDHFQQLHGPFFEGLVDEGLLAKARENSLEGVKANSTHEGRERVRCTPHPSLRDHLDEAAAQLWKDASKGRALICFDEGDGLLEGVVSVPMARVPKMLPDRTISEKGRVIWDATPVNVTCHKSRHPPALQPKHAEVARAIIWWQQKYPGIPVLLSKKDVSDAFKWIPVRAADSRFFAADLPGGAFGSEYPITIIYNSLTFGWCGAPGEYMLFAWVAKQAFHKHRPSSPEWHGNTPFRGFVLMDDTILIEPMLGVRPWMATVAVEECTRNTLGPSTLNEEKDVLEGKFEVEKLVWGLSYNTERGTRSLPPVKLEKAAHLLHLSEFDHGNYKVPLKLVQELRGNQQFWLAVMPSLTPLLQATNELLGPPDSEGYAQAKGRDFEKRRTWLGSD